MIARGRERRELETLEGLCVHRDVSIEQEVSKVDTYEARYFSPRLVCYVHSYLGYNSCRQ